MEHYGDGDSVSAPHSAFLCVLRFSYYISVWFLHLEALWDGEDLSNRHRYQAVVRALPSEITACLSSVLATPREADRYAAITSPFLAAFGRSREAYSAALDFV